MRQDIIVVFWWRGKTRSKLHRLSRGKPACGLSKKYLIKGKPATDSHLAGVKLKAIQALAKYSDKVCGRCIPKARR
jgi:hypothetical protein